MNSEAVLQQVPRWQRVEMQRVAVVEEALTWLGTPWRHMARSKGYGVDCGQLLIAVFACAGITPVVRVDPYPQDWALHRGEEKFLGIVETYAQRCEDSPALPGDVVLFKYGRCISHAAIVVTWPRVIHAYLNAAAVVMDDVRANEDLSTRYVGAWSCWR